MSNNPFENNPTYTRLFQITSNQSACYIFERVELYQSKIIDPTTGKGVYILFRYTVDNASNIMPVRTILKFTDLLYTEVLQTGNKAELFVITGYKDINMALNRINMCCGLLSYVLQVEKSLYDFLL